MIYNQGRSFPPSAQGAGLIFIAIGILLFLVNSHNYFMLLFAYVSIWIMFSKTSIDTDKVKDGYLMRRFGFFPFIFSRKIKFADFDAGVVKVDRVVYRTTQSVGVVILSSQDNADEYVALSFKYKNQYEFEVVYKGTKKEIMTFIRTNLKDTNLTFFDGVVKRGYELTL